MVTYLFALFFAVKDRLRARRDAQPVQARPTHVQIRIEVSETPSLAEDFSEIDRFTYRQE